MKLALVGVGEFGIQWYETLKRDYRDLTIVVVDNQIAAREKLDPEDHFYLSLSDAIEREQPAVVLNSTPPDIHTEINNIAFDYQLPVLCEKPISDNYGEAIRIVERAARENIPFMIAENYRRHPAMRRLKALVEEGAIGELSTVHIDFYQSYRTNKPYFTKMEHPLLMDVTVHHFDLIRYLLDSEGKRIFAKSYTPSSTWFPGKVGAGFWLEMENGIFVSYNGTLVAQAPTTSWWGEWTLEGTEGSLLFKDARLRMNRAGQSVEIDDWLASPANGCLDEFLLSLQENRPAETSGTEYLKTEALVYYALESNREGREVDVRLPAWA